MFWTLVTAAIAWTVRVLLDRGAEGWECLLFLSLLIVWLGATGISIWRRVYGQRQWNKVAERRSELARLIRERRQQMQSDDPREPGRTDRTRPP
jgi:hypothetical protein